MAGKRKRVETPAEDPSIKIAGKLHHDLKEVKKAAKKAKVFETQKLARKLKALKLKDEAPEEIKECEALLEELKILNHDAVANTAVKTKLLKDRLLSENPSIQSAITQELSTAEFVVPAAARSAQAKVQSRFLSSKLLASEVALLVADLRNFIISANAEEAEEESVGSARPSKKVDVGHEHEAEAEEDMEMDTDPRPGPSMDIANKMRRMHLEVDDESMDGWESGTVDGENDSDDSEEIAELADDELEGGPHEIMGSPTKTRALSPRSSKTKSAASQFLPSLSVGYIPGGDSDGSDWSDGREDDDIAPKKNRRGQRARRAIWEKKYGRGANHKKKEAQEEKTAKKSLPPQRNASTFRGKKQPETDASRVTDSGWGSKPKPVAYVPKPPAPAPMTSAQPDVHPSWAAKLKQRERESATITPAIQSRKIKF